MEKQIKWRFAGNGGTKKNGLDTTDFHTFMDDPAASLAREICQNSNDARDPSLNKPAIVEFHSFDIKTSSIPGVEQLVEELGRCEDYWQGDNAEIAARVKDMRILLQAERINVLRISDFNTTGLVGVSDHENEKSPWYSLLHGSGESGKSVSEGGSKGVGKYATFVNSLVRTVFYSTTSKAGESGYQGIAYFCSSKIKDSPIGELTLGIGYYGIDQKNNPIDGSFSLDPSFKRAPNQSGTDVYIIGFDSSKGWKSDIITKVLDSFMVAIHYGRLKVVVDDIEIAKANIGDIVFNEQLIRSDLRRSVVSQYVLLSGDESVIHKTLSIKYDGTEVSKAELYLKRFQGDEQKYATTACSMIRYPFMKIKNLKNIVNSSMTCSALCIIPDGQLTYLFKAAENPEHTDWIWNRIKDTTQRALAQTLYSDLYSQIQNTILEALKTPDTDETDAAGASRYLPEHEPGKEKPADKKGREVEKPRVSKPMKKRTSEINTYEDDPNGNGIGLDIVDEMEPPDTETLEPSGTNNSDGGDPRPGDNHGQGKKGKGDKEAFVRQHMKGITYHFFCVNKKNGEYVLSFVPPKDVERAECIVNMVDESSSATPIRILSAHIGDKELEVKDEKKIYFPMSEGERITIRIKTNMKELFSAEVHLYVAR